MCRGSGELTSGDISTSTTSSSESTPLLAAATKKALEDDGNDPLQSTDNRLRDFQRIQVPRNAVSVLLGL